jgi:hypothetical protein
LPPLEDHQPRGHFRILSRCQVGRNTSCNTTGNGRMSIDIHGVLESRYTFGLTGN